MKTIFYLVITVCIHLQYCQSLFFQKQLTLSKAQQAAQEKIKDIVIQCMEQEKSNPLHVYALFAVHAQNPQAKCVLLCVMHNCHLMDKDGNYDEQKVEEIMKKTEPKKPPSSSRFSFLGFNKASDNETLKECIDKDTRNNSCEKAYVFTRCLEKQTKKSFNKLTGDLFNGASANSDTLFEIDGIETTPSSILSSLKTMSYAESTIMDSDRNTSSVSTDGIIVGAEFNTTIRVEDGNGTKAEVEDDNNNNNTIVGIEDSDNNSTAKIEKSYENKTTVGIENADNGTTIEMENGNYIYNASSITKSIAENITENSAYNVPTQGPTLLMSLLKKFLRS